MEVRPIDANAVEALFYKQIELGATDAFGAFDDALQDTPTLRCEECQNYDAAFDCHSSCPNCERTLSLNPLRDAIYHDAVAHGLWEDHDKEQASHAEFCAEYPQYAFDLEQGNRGECALHVLSECFELRDTSTAEEYAEELADVIIMSLSVAGKLGIDIDKAVRDKMAYNKGRSWKHEGE